ncbi:MAG: hypothetical protein KDK99_14780 [Verrucomicrobiales bacterium]|nr:hypothetical protein [Verrucomicrobiales bacterium]
MSRCSHLTRRVHSWGVGVWLAGCGLIWSDGGRGQVPPPALAQGAAASQDEASNMPAAASESPVVGLLPAPVDAAEAAAPPLGDGAPGPAIVSPTRAAAVAPVSSTSSTGQFVVHGSDLMVRHAMGKRCEQIAKDLDKLLHTPEPWVTPIVVLIKPQLPGAPGDEPISTQISQLGHGGYHLQLTVPERSGLRPADLRRELVQLLMVERILRQHPKLEEGNVRLLPSWVLTGVLEAMDYKHRVRPSAVFAALLKSGKIFSIEEILDTSPADLDALSQSIYQASSCALVLALLDQPEGGLRLQRFLGSLADSEESERQLLNQWFPNLAQSESSLNKWWSLQLAALATPGVAETLDPYQTARALDQAITLRFAAPLILKLPPPTTVAAIASLPDLPPDNPPPSATPAPANTTASRSQPAAKSESKPAPKATPAPRPKPSRAASVASADADEEAEAMAESAEENAESDEKKDRPSLLRRLFGGGDRKEEEPAMEDQPAEEPPEEKPAEPASKKSESRRSEKPEPPKEDPPKPAPPKAEPPKAEPSSSAEEPEKKRGFNPFRMFRKKDKSDSSEGDGESQESSSWLPQTWSQGLAWISPSLSQISHLLPRARAIQATTPLPVPPPPSPPPTAQSPTAQPPPSTTPTAPAPAASDVRITALTAYPLEDYRVLDAMPDRVAILKNSADQLAALGQRGNVLFREVIRAYITAITDISNGKTKDMDTRLRQLRQAATRVLDQARAVQDHLDWFEASQSTEYTGLFEDYLRLPEKLKDELPQRSDPITEYIDAVEAQLQR